MPMNEDRIVDTAYNKIRSRYKNDAWFALSPRTITDFLYKEIRKIDAERLLGCELSREEDGSEAERLAP